MGKDTEWNWNYQILLSSENEQFEIVSSFLIFHKICGNGSIHRWNKHPCARVRTRTVTWESIASALTWHSIIMWAGLLDWPDDLVLTRMWATQRHIWVPVSRMTKWLAKPNWANEIIRNLLNKTKGEPTSRNGRGYFTFVVAESYADWNFEWSS